MYSARPRLSQRPPIGYRQQIPPGDANWKFGWPSIISIIIGVIIIIFTLVIIALEIASLAKGTGSGYKTAATGAGIWCGFFFLVAGILMLFIKFMLRAHLWATLAFIATIIAAAFSVILIGLDAKAVKDGHNISNLFEYYFGSSYFLPKYRILAAQLAFACIIFLLCILFIILYIVVLITGPKRRRPQQYGFRPPLRY